MLEQELEIQKRLRYLEEKSRSEQNQNHALDRKSEEEVAMVDAVQHDGLEEENDESTFSCDPTCNVGVLNDDSLSYIMSEESGCFTSPGSNSPPTYNLNLELERVKVTPLLLTRNEQRMLEEHRWRVLEELEQCRMTSNQEEEAFRRKVVAKQKLHIQCMADEENMVIRSQNMEHQRVVEEQRMILKVIQQQQEERKRDEEFNIRLIQKLKLEEERKEHQSFVDQIEVEGLYWRNMEVRRREGLPAPQLVVSSPGLRERETMLEEWAAENRRREAEEAVRRSTVSNSRKKLNLVTSLEEVRSGAWAAGEVDGGRGGVGELRSQSAGQKSRNQVKSEELFFITLKGLNTKKCVPPRHRCLFRKQMAHLHHFTSLATHF